MFRALAINSFIARVADLGPLMKEVVHA